MGYYVIRQGEEFLIESQNHILRVKCDKDGDIRMTRLERRQTICKKQAIGTSQRT